MSEAFKRIMYTQSGMGSSTISFKYFKFPGGEVHVKLVEPLPKWCQCTITASLQDSDDIMFVLLAVDVLRSAGAEHISLYIPYVPFARQDRVMVQGEPFSLKVFASLINSLQLECVSIYDGHSDVAPALINNCRNLSNWGQIDQFITQNIEGPITIISPDAGAYKKVYKVCQEISKYHAKRIDGIVVANKIRDVTNGEIKGCEVYGKVEGKNCLVIDDICDGGRTFIELGKVLRQKGCNSLYLFISHGIFSKGLPPLWEYYDLIGTTNSLEQNHVDDMGCLKVLDIRSLA